MGYVYMLRRLAYIAFKSQKFTESERYFSVVAKVIPELDKNAMSVFSSHKNMLLLYSHTNIDKAVQYATGLQKDSENSEFTPIHQKELQFMTANVHLLNGDYQVSKNLYRHLLKK